MDIKFETLTKECDMDTNKSKLSFYYHEYFSDLASELDKHVVELDAHVLENTRYIKNFPL